MSGPPGACAHPRVVGVIVTVLAPASFPRMEESLAVALQDKPSSATLLSAQVRLTILIPLSHRKKNNLSKTLQ